MLTGTWIPQAAELCGQTLPLPATRLVITGSHYVIEHDDGRDEGTLAIDLTVIPHTIDLVGTAGPNAGKIIPAIFRIRGNVLQLCYAVGDGPAPQPRPSSLSSTTDLPQLLLRYRRAMP